MSCSVPYTPMIVAKQSFVNQTTNVGTTTIYTPTEDGDYEVSVYAAQDSSLSGGATITLSWTDEYSACSVTLDTNHNVPALFEETLHIPSGNAIQIAIAYSGATYPYSAYFTVTKK